MMIDQAFQAKIVSLYATYPIRIGSAEGQTPPYHVMIKIADMEQPEVLCKSQGSQGKALFQFSTYAGNDSTQTLTIAEALKNVVNTVIGEIGTTPNKFIIDYNKTSGVTLINEGSNSENVWGVIFESAIWWKSI